MLMPLSDRVLIKEIKEEDKTEGGIILPEGTESEPTTKGEVLAVGIGKCNTMGQRIPLQVKVGDVVAFYKHAGTKIKKTVVLHEDEIIGIVK